jgi:hypothetical protein
MAFPTAVNSQITDAITQANVKVLGDAPAQAMGSVFQAMAHSIGIIFENAANQQQQNFTLSQAVTTRCVQVLLGDRAGPAK